MSSSTFHNQILFNAGTFHNKVLFDVGLFSVLSTFNTEKDLVLKSAANKKVWYKKGMVLNGSDPVLYH